jgi:hypothetical protein
VLLPPFRDVIGQLAVGRLALHRALIQRELFLNRVRLELLFPLRLVQTEESRAV